MKLLSLYFISILGVFNAEHLFSQDMNAFSSDKNKFSIGFELSGGFPVGNFNNAIISFPCNSSVNAGSIYTLLLGYQYNDQFGFKISLSEGLYELDPSSLGVTQLIDDYPNLYQSATVLKNGELISQSLMVGAYYDLPLSKSGRMFLKSHIYLGIMSCSVPELEVVGYHNPGAPDGKGNSIDTIETWNTPKMYSYFLTYRVGTALYYMFNEKFGVFAGIEYQGSSLGFTDVPVVYNLSVYSNNVNTNTSTTITDYNKQREVNPTISYQSIGIGIGCEIRF